MRRAVSLGVDVAEARKGLDVVALDADRTIVASRGRLTVKDAVALTVSLRPSVVCIDGPSGWSTSGASRHAERQLAMIGIRSYRTGPDPGDHPFYRWMRVGFQIYERLASSYPVYRGGEVTGTAAEVFPHATACLLAGHLPSRATAKAAIRRAVLRRCGVAEHGLPTIDRVDAALGALTGLVALTGGHTSVGEPGEGVILLPVPCLPAAPLPRGRQNEPAWQS